MRTLPDAQQGSMQRSLADRGDDAPVLSAALAESLLRQQNSGLQAEIAMLREANEHLVMATVNAQGLRDDAEAANRRQNEFLAMLAHELRNPLSPISMAAAMLERVPDASPQQLNLTRVIGRQVDHMARLLDDLLDAARISSGKVMLSIQPVLLSEVLEQAVETIQPRIKERQQKLRLDLPADALAVDGDKVRLTQVFSNLLGNASKYTGDFGELSLSAAVAGDQLIVTIEDNGHGIAPDIIPHIFDLFTQGPRSLARSEGGLGIGLNVVRNLVTMHRGTVEAHSAGADGGSRFTVTLPLSNGKADPGPAPGAVRGNGSGRQVLLIEDNVDACHTLENLLALEGHAVRCAYDGASGLALALESRADVVICDIGLPVLDGYDVIRRLRQSPHGQRPVAIALSGYCQADDRARALGAGFDHYFVKPVSPDALLSLLASAAVKDNKK
ncbi:MAG: hybrid sensor histidine kinase/response regulator [Massilia sp.]|nr:hybrid sensor histidine kinase/response regulator [Massilia sp.]